MHSPFDQLAKNILRDFFVLFGAAQPAAEVPPTDALEIDLWYAPDPDREPLRTQATSGVVRAIAAEPAMLELFSQTLGDRAFHACLHKRYQWQHVLELRDGTSWPLLQIWITSPGRPDGVLDDYGFVPAEAGPTGHYVTTKAAWRIHILVIGELPRTRETVLLRLLGRGRALRAAIADLLALPGDAWEKKVALPWLSRLSFELPKEPEALSDEEKALMTDIQEWFEQYQRQVRDEGVKLGRDEGVRLGRDEGVKLGRDEGVKLGRDEGVKLGRTQAIGRLFERRLGRALAEGERQVLADRLARLGEERVDDVLLGLDRGALAAWLADPAAN